MLWVNDGLLTLDETITHKVATLPNLEFQITGWFYFDPSAQSSKHINLIDKYGYELSSIQVKQDLAYVDGVPTNGPQPAKYPRPSRALGFYNDEPGHPSCRPPPKWSHLS